MLIAYLNLRGVKESGKIFMVPTYLFMLAMALMIGVGFVKSFGAGGLTHIRLSKGAVGDLLNQPHGTAGIADAVLKGAGHLGDPGAPSPPAPLPSPASRRSPTA